jgi:hypothetical protein
MYVGIIPKIHIKIRIHHSKYHPVLFMTNIYMFYKVVSIISGTGAATYTAVVVA